MRRRPAIVGFLTVAMACAGVRADEATRREDQLKAAYLFNFVKFVEYRLDLDSTDWPDQITQVIAGWGRRSPYRWKA